MAKKKATYAEIMKLAEKYGVESNAFFRTAAERYHDQVEMMKRLREQMETDGLMVEHVTSTGGINMEINPIAIQLPKYNDTANKTLSLMLDIVQKLGKQADPDDGLELDLSDV